MSSGSGRSTDFGSSSEISGDSIFRNRFTSNLKRPRSLINLVRHTPRHNVLQLSTPNIPSLIKEDTHTTKAESSIKKGWKSIVTIIVVEAKGLPGPPSESSAHVYCKIRLGTQTWKTKLVPRVQNPQWRERLKFFPNKDHILRISLWEKGKHKNFMGSCTTDLSGLEKERSHDIWQQLDDGFGSVHLNITVCTIDKDNVVLDPEPDLERVEEEFALLNLNKAWKVVGQLYVKVIGAKGLSGKPNAYCTLELDNEKLQTPVARAGSDPMWNKYYIFNVYDVTSTLDVKIHDNSLVNAILMEYLGKVQIPLLRISNGVQRWYALKDKSKRNSAKGKSPRILLEMKVIWNPVKATIRLFRPKEVKYIKKPPKFNIALVHSNMEVVRDIFDLLHLLNEAYKHFLEWENRDMCSIGLVVWLIFWYNFEVWIIPLMLLLPFIFHLIISRNFEHYFEFLSVYRTIYEIVSAQNGIDKIETKIHNFTDKIQNLPETTLKITNGIEYTVSLLERIYNLISFKVPFLSYVSMMMLAISSLFMYLFPVKYMLMVLGTYKYTRKWLNPQRTPNNDLLDFFSRVPDFAMMKDWKELSVPEPGHQIHQIQQIQHLEEKVNKFEMHL